MIRTTFCIYGILFLLLCFFGFSCKSKRSEKPVSTIAQSPEELQQKTPELIRSYLEATEKTGGKLDDLIPLTQFPITRFFYEKLDYKPMWSGKESWNQLGDSLISLIENSKLFGLFPEDYHNREITVFRKQFVNDSLSKGDRRDAALWAKADILLTDGLIQIIKDIKLGRLGRDSITLRKDSILSNEFYYEQFQKLQDSGSLAAIIKDLEPRNKGYNDLKQAIRNFLDSLDYKTYAVVPSPAKDPLNFKRILQQRLYEENFLSQDSIVLDSLQLAEAVKKFQKKHGLTQDGKAGEATVRMMNLSDKEKFIRIAISLDKFKLLPEKMPDHYIWVNLPGYYLQLWDGDTVKMTSKIICGKPGTKTPQLNSAISEIITYPQWTVPGSIIQKEILPAVKKNTGYLARKGFSLVDKNGDVIDPDSVDWSKYSKTIPYRVVQGSGDANALGVLKFNFSNKYSVYLHDTNQRYLFGNASRAFSHGCVRVQEWRPLASYILNRDVNVDSLRTSKMDSLNKWLGNKEKHSLAIRNRVPLFIRYFTCDARGGQLNFYDDIYGEDERLRKQYFSSK
jgi:murein L,D-transpeptidase YcbB/YkuD